MDAIEHNDTYYAALERIRKVFADSSEVVAAFICYARGSEIPPAILIEEADKTLGDLARYRAGLRQTELSTTPVR